MNVFGGNTLLCLEKHVARNEGDALAFLAFLVWYMFFAWTHTTGVAASLDPRWEDLVCQTCIHLHMCTLTHILQSCCIVPNFSLVLEETEGSCNNERGEMST